jgi:hypothetical protein
MLQGSHVSGWVVTHAEACPRDPSVIGRAQASLRLGHAQAYSRRITAMLRRRNLNAEETETVLANLANMLRTGWTNYETCERAILSALAFADMDRMDVESILNSFLTHESLRC